jgi:outer membrane protein assembly factor BamB
LSGTAIFAWQGRDVLAAYGNCLVLLDGKSFGEVQPVSAGSVAVSSSSTGTTSLLAVSKAGGITAFTVEDKDGRPVLKRAWNSPVNASAAPVVANGVVYAPAGERTGARLYALDERTGRKLYSSETAIDSGTDTAGLAVANGHVCFGSRGGTLYCFGLPIDL